MRSGNDILIPPKDWNHSEGEGEKPEPGVLKQLAVSERNTGQAKRGSVREAFGGGG